MPILSRLKSISKPETHTLPALRSADPASWLQGEQEPLRRLRSRGWLDACAYDGCQSGWLHPWRSRSIPIFEGGWTCSAECTIARVLAAVRREMEGRRQLSERHRHRNPLGLLLLQQGWVSQIQLRQALDAQKAVGTGRLGDWLIQLGAVNEAQVTRALALQWSCAILRPEPRGAPALSVVMPRLFVEAFSALPLRLAAGRVLYLGFEERLDPVLALALERMAGVAIESGVVPGSEFRPGIARMLEAEYPEAELVEAASESAAAQTLARRVERVRPSASRLVRVHDCLWLRMWLRVQKNALPERGDVKDVVCSIGDF